MADIAAECDHGVTFDEATATELLRGWAPSDNVAFIVGNPMHQEVRRRRPRLHGLCPKGCGFNGIAYASWAHYTLGDW